MASYVTPKKGVAFICYVDLTSQANTKTFQVNPTLASGDAKVSIDGGAFANLATLPAVTPASGRSVKVDLSTSEMNGDNIKVVFSDAAGAEWCDLALLIQTTARQIDDLATSSALATVQSDTDDIQARLPAALVSGRMDASVGAMAASVLTATAIAADAITAAKVADGTIDAATFAAGAINAAAIATDAITAAKIAADAIGASELAADAVTEIQAGLATSAALATVQADTDDIQTRLPAALVSGRIDASVGAMASGVLTATAIAADAITAAKVADGTIDAATFAAGAINAAAIATDAITAAKIAADAIGASELAADAVTEIQSGLATAAALATVQADTDDIQTRLPAALVSGRMSADAVAISGSTGAADSVEANIANLDAAVSTRASQASVDTIDDFVDTEVAAIKAKTDQLTFTNAGKVDAAILAAGDFVQAAADKVWATAARTLTSFGTLAADVWAVATRVLTAGTNIVLAKGTGVTGFNDPTAGAIADQVWEEAIADHSGTVGSTAESLNAAGSAGDPWNTALPGAYAAGKAGKIVGDNLNATVSSRATQTSVDTIDDFLDTEVAAIKAKTDNLPADPADASDIAAAFATVNTKLDTIDDFVDTEVALILAAVDTEIAAIKAKTDNLPADPADASDIAASFATVNTKLDTIDDFVDTEVAAIKAVADKLDTAVELDGAVYRFTTNALEQAPTGGSAPTVGQIADAVWEEALVDHSGTVGSTAEALDAASAGSSPGSVADAVWDEARAGHVAAGSFGQGVASVVGAVGSVTAKVTPIDVDGLTFASAMELIIASEAGVAVPSGATVAFKKRDGTTTKLTITYGLADGERTASVIT